MILPKEAFIKLIRKIVYEHMDRDQLTQFDIDGQEMIEAIFQPQEARAKKDIQTVPTFGISHAALDSLNTATGFGSLVISCITLYIEFRKKKKKPLKERLTKLEYLEQLKGNLSKKGLDPKLIEAIDKKYGDELIDLLDNLESIE